MALTDLKVWEEKTYSAYQELLDYNVNQFNQATMGGLVLTSGSMLGDFSTEAFWARIAGSTVRRRNVYGSGSLSAQALSMKERSKVKVAAGTYPIDLTPSQFTWIQKSPEEAAAVYGRQLAQDTMNDMLSVAIKVYKAAIGAQPTNVRNPTTQEVASYKGLLSTAALFGDRASDIQCWLMHSAVMYEILGSNLDNANHLFTFGDIKVMQDGFGRPFVVTDNPNLYDTVTSKVVYSVLGLTPGAVVIEQNNDFLGNTDNRNGGENISRTYQAEWSYNVSQKGFSWNKTDGGHSPTDAALATATNWIKTAASIRDLGGVIGMFI